MSNQSIRQAAERLLSDATADLWFDDDTGVIEPWFVASVLSVAQAHIAELDSREQQAERKFPILDGPSVPWSYMAPHEGMAKRNHSQSLDRLSKRGGLSAAEAELVVTGRDRVSVSDDKREWDALADQWRERAERVNCAWLHREQQAAD